MSSFKSAAVQGTYVIGPHLGDVFRSSLEALCWFLEWPELLGSIAVGSVCVPLNDISKLCLFVGLVANANHSFSRTSDFATQYTPPPLDRGSGG